MNNHVILFGGSFDPIHTGHIEVAKASKAALCAQKIIFIPANRSPHKPSSTFASAKHRCHMVKLAIDGNEDFIVSDYEITKPAPSYTLDTVKYFKQQYGNARISFLIGADTIPDLHKWYKIDELIKLCTLCTMYRGGFDEPDFSVLKDVFSDETVNQLQINIVQTPILDISSSNIRKLFSEGKSVDEYLPSSVADYIKQNNLYGYQQIK